ncbi:MAG TPA: FAD-linked oxidase C-terminal domain-containing protein, partial [Urbifossiella sp.]|nr:FAD-linked oxidase C-terminal domain-containing protein [Urbifossiella sp.]
HGYTRDYLMGLNVVWDSGAADVVGTQESSNPRTIAIRDATAALLEPNRQLIEESRPKTPFTRCGYQLHDVMPGGRLDLAKLLVGSEGTLGFITAATLRTIPLPGGVCAVLLGFGSLDAALHAALDLRALRPVSGDLLDRRLLASMRTAAAVAAALLVTFEADSEREARELAETAVEKLRVVHRLVVLEEPVCDPGGLARIRGARQAAVSGLYGLGKGPRPLAFIEDVGVPAEQLPAFIERTQDALKRFELSASFLIHALTGQVHTRPMVELDNPVDREKLWPLAEVVHGIALELGGTVSAQHGTGIARTPWIEKQYGPILPLFRELKRIFDPKNILNPGKIVGPDPSRPAWPLRTGFKADEAEQGRSPLLVWASGSPRDEVGKCTGCGDCRPQSPRGRMCPAVRASRSEATSPRAMVNLFPLLDANTSLASDDVKAISRHCVNCKMCRDECPAHVDVPRLMLEAKAARHAEDGLDRADWFLARTEGLARLGSNFAPFVNLLLARRSVRWLLEKAFGLSRQRRLPAFALRNFTRRARGMGLARRRKSDALQKVAYFVDVFANYNDPSIGAATVAVLRHNGIEVYVPPRQVGCGAAPLSVGDLEAARDAARRNIRALVDLVREGYRIVCSEPTAALMLSQDYLDILDDPDAAALAANTVELTAFLGELLDAGRLRTDFRRLELTLGHHVPCHIKALRTPPAGPRLLELIPGLTVRTIDVSCSGMAGTWGLKAANYDTSFAVGKRMLDEVNRPGILFGSSECSACRMQMQEGSGKRALHPVQYLALAYGLLPEIGAKLRQPLGGLLSG